MGIFFWADPHLGHRNIIKHCNRPFDTIEEHDRVIIDNFNSKVDPKDEVWILGDLSYRSGSVAKYVQQLNGKLHLIAGNHDRRALKTPRLFASVHKFGYELAVQDRDTRKGSRKIVLCHYPLLSWNACHYAESYQLHGHHHGNWAEHWPSLENRLQLDVGVDSNNFFPWSYQEIKEVLSKRNVTPIKRRGKNE